MKLEMRAKVTGKGEKCEEKKEEKSTVTEKNKRK